MSIALMLAACSSDNEELVQQPGEGQEVKLTTSVIPFDGELITRSNIAGNSFVNGDRMKLKIICPFDPDHTHFGETTYSNTFDGMWLFKWKNGSWVKLEPSDEVDVAGAYKYTSSYDLYGQYEAQQTPYVYTASTWSENILFMANGLLFSQYSYIFQADQTLEKNYLKSDLLWAQSYMQTGSYNVHLSFNHVMACLRIDISALSPSSNAVVTLEGMPDIDQREVVVGNYYAERSKVYSNNGWYGYKQKHSCDKENNGRVLGVVVNNESTKIAEIHPMTGNPVNTGNTYSLVPNTGTYTAHRDGGFYYLIVPPCALTTNAKIWIRDGEKRYSYELVTPTFEQGKLYPINISTPTPTPQP